MPEARDRLVRPVDLAAIFTRRRTAVLGILEDVPETSANPFGSPIGRAHNMTPRVQTRAVGRGGGFGTPRGGAVRGRRSSSATRRPMGIENTPIGSARRGRSLLPSWYPRTPLRDVTAIMRAIERRRASLGEGEGQPIGTPMTQNQRDLGSSDPLSGAQLEREFSLVTPNPAVRLKPCPPPVDKVSKILLDIANQGGEGSECLTPQKKLLNSIDKVEKVVMDELNKLKRTPTAKKAEREKRVRTLMSMSFDSFHSCNLVPYIMDQDSVL